MSPVRQKSEKRYNIGSFSDRVEWFVQLTQEMSLSPLPKPGHVPRWGSHCIMIQNANLNQSLFQVSHLKVSVAMSTFGQKENIICIQ